MASFWSELRRRNVFRVGIAYLAAAWLLIEVVETLVSIVSAPAWVPQVVLFSAALGFPLALVLAWFYELTPQGVKAAADVGALEPSPPMGRRIDFTIIGLLVLAVGFLLADDLISEDTAELDHSIAVLPFAELGPGSEGEYFAEAMTDELIGRLGRIDGVRVMSRQSMARFKGTDRDVRDIAAELGVAYVLEGVVRRAGDRARVTVQLTDASSGFEQWSDVFDDESDDWFSLHEDMSFRIAEALNVYLDPSEAAAFREHFTDNQAAYEAFWRGWILLESFHGDVTYPEEKLSAAEMHFRRALQLDEDYALAVAGLSMVNYNYYFEDIQRTPERRERGRALAQRALELSPDAQEVHMALGYMHVNDGNFAAAAEEFSQALNLGPETSYVWCHLSFACLRLGPPDPQRAEAAAREALESDPTWPYSYQLLGRALQMQGRFDEALEAHDAGLELNPGHWPNQIGRALTQLELGNYRNALASLERAQELSKSDNQRAGVLVRIGASHAALGEIDEGLVAFERGLQLGFDDFDELAERSYFSTVRNDRRFQALINEYRNN